MTTRGQFRQVVRDELGDVTSPNYVWTDGLLNGFINDGISQLSVDLPPVKFLTIAAVVGQRDYQLAWASSPVGPRGIRSVEYPAGVALPQGNTAEQYEAGLSGMGSWQLFGQCWEFIRSAGDNQKLRFRYGLADATQTIQLLYYGLYATLANDSDVLDVSGFDEGLLKYATCGRALAWLDETRSKRSGGTALGAQGPLRLYRKLYSDGVISRNRSMGGQSFRLVG